MRYRRKDKLLRKAALTTALFCIGQSCGAFGATAQQLSTAIPQREVEPSFDGLVDVGGYRIHARVYGEGYPAVVLAYGVGGFQDYFNGIVTGLAPHTTVITYDRGGYERSEMATRPRNAEVTTDEILSLLRALEIPGPYLLAGHSLGGLFVHLFAARFPEEVAGLVLMDSTHPDFLADFEATLKPEEQRMFQETREQMMGAPPPPGGPGEDMRFSLQNIEILRAAGGLPDVPLAVMTSPFEGRISPLHRRLSEESLSRFVPMALEYAQKLAAMSSTGRVVQVPDATHHFPLEKPGDVVQSVLEVLEEAKGG